MSPTRSLSLAAAVYTTAALLAYAAFRLAGTAVGDATVRTSAFAAIAFVISALCFRVKAGSFTAAASAATVGAGAAMIGAMMGASTLSDLFWLLFVGFFAGIALAVFALMKDLDEQSSPKLLLFVPMAQIMAFQLVFGY